jgi:hypothetical protein
MKKQTAVEWLYMKSKERELDVFDLQQAKAMEKEQIVDAAKIVLFNSTGHGDEAAEKYYNETYGK